MRKLDLFRRISVRPPLGGVAVDLEVVEIDTMLRDVMRYRNAFTHGRFSTDGEAFWLSYFEGQSRKQELTDDYLDIVGNTLHAAYNKTDWLLAELKETKAHC